MLKRRRTEQDELHPTRDFPRRSATPTASPSPPEPAPAEPAAAEPPPAEPSPSPAARQRRRRRRGSFLRQIGAVVGLVVAGYAILPLLLNASRMQPIVEQTLSQNIGRRVRVGSLRFSPTFGTLIASDVTVADDPLFSSAPFIHAQRVDISVRRLPLILSRAIEITDVSIEEPTVTLIRNATQWNFYAVLEAGPTLGGEVVPGPSLRVARGILVVRASDHDDPFVLRDLNLDAPRFSTAMENPFTLAAAVGGGGKVKVNGNWGPVKWQGRAPSVPLNILVSARGVAIAESNLLAGIAPAVGGVLSLDGTIESDGSALQVKGNAELTQLKLATNGAPTKDPLAFTLGLEHNLENHSGTLTHFDLSLRKGTATVRGKYLLADDGAVVKFQAMAQGVQVTPLSGLLPAAGFPLPPGATLQGGLAFVELSLDGNLKSLTTAGTVQLNNAKLMNFDLEERLAAVDGLDLLHVSRDLPIDEWQSTVHITPEKMVLSELEITVAGVGVFTGQGAVDANRTLDFRMSAVRHGVADKRPIPFVVRGASISPIFRQPGKTT